ncbi:helix-turn-helix domain-containing protein [Candidatus Poribacteria bacterium]|nr:helix-turn-helix domain-containing protein [Candidatus Poribacteria bacterium]
MEPLPLAKRVRRKLRLSQREFAERYGLSLRSLQQWEQRRRELPEATRSYLLVIEQIPEIVGEAYASARDRSPSS